MRRIQIGFTFTFNAAFESFIPFSFLVSIDISNTSLAIKDRLRVVSADVILAGQKENRSKSERAQTSSSRGDEDLRM